MNLYQLTNEYREIMDNLYDENGEIDDQMLAKLNDNSLNLEKKAIAVASYIKNLEAEGDAIATAKKAMAEREKRLKRKSEDLNGYLFESMNARGITKVSCPYFEISIKKCPLSVDILEVGLIPEEYTRTKTETSPDKIRILADMKEGVIIPGAMLKQNLRLDIR